MGGFYPPMKHVLFAAALILPSLFAGPVTAETAADMDAKQAAKEIIQVLKTQGPQAMQAYVANCYAQNPVSMHCLYLDAGGNQIYGYIFGVMHQLRDPYFFGAPYAARIAPVMKQAGIGFDQETQFLKTLQKVQGPALYAAYVAKN